MYDKRTENKRKDKQNVELDNNRNADLNNNGETMVSNKNAQIMVIISFLCE